MQETAPLINWDAKLETGIHVVDEEHKFLVQNLNLLNQIVHQKGIEQDLIDDDVRAVLNNLAHYTQTHFVVEEELMRTWQYPGYSAHKSEHNEFIRRVMVLTSTFAEGGMDISGTMLSFLREWLTSHILGTDHAMASFLKAQGQT